MQIARSNEKTFITDFFLSKKTFIESKKRLYERKAAPRGRLIFPQSVNLLLRISACIMDHNGLFITIMLLGSDVLIRRKIILISMNIYSNYWNDIDARGNTPNNRATHHILILNYIPPVKTKFNFI